MGFGSLISDDGTQSLEASFDTEGGWGFWVSRLGGSLSSVPVLPAAPSLPWQPQSKLFFAGVVRDQPPNSTPSEKQSWDEGWHSFILISILLWILPFIHSFTEEPVSLPPWFRTFEASLQLTAEAWYDSPLDSWCSFQKENKAQWDELIISCA